MNNPVRVSYINLAAPKKVPNFWYKVLKTDYTNYAVLWGCQSFSLFSVENTYFLSRQRFLFGNQLATFRNNTEDEIKFPNATMQSTDNFLYVYNFNLIENNNTFN